MLKLKLQYLGHLMQKANSVEKILMLGKIEVRRRWEQQRTRWLNGIIDSVDMNLSKLQDMVKNRQTWMFQSVELQRIRHDWMTEQQWQQFISPLCSGLMYSIAILCLDTSYSVQIQHTQVNFFTQIGLSILTLSHMIAIFLILVNFLSYILKFLWKYFLNNYIIFYLMEVAKSPSWFLNCWTCRQCPILCCFSKCTNVFM